MSPRTVVSLAALAASALLTASALGVVARPSVRGKPAVGKALYLRAGIFCGSCHTLKAARSTGRDGPNLDKTKPSYARIVDVVTKGRIPSRRWPTGMPGYSRELTKAEMQDIAAFVYTATHR
jgi:mono/diheme cytochrome c family protein